MANRTSFKKGNSTGVATKFQPGNPGSTKVVTPEQLEMIRKLSYGGARESVMRRACDIATNEAWQRIKARQPEIQNAIEQGDDERYQMLLDSLTKHGEKTVIAAFFELKCRYGWREDDPAKDTGPRIVINMPGASPASSQPVGQVIGAEFARIEDKSEMTLEQAHEIMRQHKEKKNAESN